MGTGVWNVGRFGGELQMQALSVKSHARVSTEAVTQNHSHYRCCSG